MALKVVLDNLDGVDPSLHEHYTEKDGKFYLDIDDDVRRHPKGASLVAALDRIKQEKATLTEKLTEVEAKLAELPDDFDAEKFATDMDELAKLRKGKKADPDDEDARAQVKRLYEQRIAGIEAKNAADKQALEDEKKQLESEIERLIGEEGLTKALVTSGVDKRLLQGATSLLKKSVQVKRDEDGKWKAFVETDVGETSVDEFVQNWAQSDDGQPYLGKPAGGGAPGSDNIRLGENPWDTQGGKVKPNLTKQQNLIKSNPDRARKLAQAAGVQPSW